MDTTKDMALELLKGAGAIIGDALKLIGSDPADHELRIRLIDLQGEIVGVLMNENIKR